MKKELINAGFTIHEAICIEWQYKFAGGFQENLLLLIRRADSGNKLKLSRGFHDEVLAMRLFQEEPGWWQEVEARYLNYINPSNGQNKLDNEIRVRY